MKIAYVCSHTFLQDCIDSSSVVLDCGLNQGAFSEWLSNNIGCSVYGFEPDPRLFSVLPRLTRCSFYQLAVSDSQGAARFNLGDTKCSSLHYKESETVNAIEVQVITLPEFCTKHGIQKVDLLKLDIEGAEVPVLAGLDEAFLVSRKALNSKWRMKMMMKYRHTLIVGLILCWAGAAFGSHPYISNPGALFEGFENVGDWTVLGTGATAVNDANFFKQGSQSIKLNAAGGNSVSIVKSVSLDFSNGDGFSIWFYIVDKTKIATLQIRMFSSSDWSKYFSAGFSPDANGWNYRVFSKAETISSGGGDWVNPIVEIKFTLNPQAGEDASVNFDDLRFGIVGQPKVIISFDDAWSSQIDKAYPIMSANGQRAVLFINTNAIGDYGMTLANLQTLWNAGWDICNHTAAHKRLTTVSQEEMEADIDNGYDWLVANGFGYSAKFFAYPYGSLNDAVVAKVKERHIVARAGSGCIAHFDIVNYYDLQYKLAWFYVGSSTSVAAVQTRIDRVIERSGLLILMFHGIVDSGATGDAYLTADFQAISDYLKAKQDAGLLEVITFSDYYDALIKWHRLEPEPFCPEMDFNGDCKVDFKDLALFTQSWLECNLEPKSACWE